MDNQTIYRKLAVLIVFLVLYTLKASVDKILSELRQTQKQNDDWHRLSAAYIIVVTVVIGFLYSGVSWTSLVVGFYAMALRGTYFPILLNKKRGKDTLYLSDGWWDSIWKGNENLYFATFFAIVVSCAVFILLN